MGRFKVELDIDDSPFLSRYFGYHWAAIGNLGVDVLLLGTAPLLGLEAAVKLIVLAIPPLTAIGFLWVAREVHGRIPPTAFFALPFIYGYPFLFGFVNFTLSVALAFLAFALWLRLTRLDRIVLRSWLFVPISVLVFFCHIYGWALLGLLSFSAETVRLHDRGRVWPGAVVEAALRTSVMALPLVIMLVWKTESHPGATDHWFDFSAKIQWILSALRDRWEWFDVSAVLTLIVVVEARRQEGLGLARNLALCALALSVTFVLLPLVISGSAYADMRFVPYMFALALLAISLRPEASAARANLLAAVGLAFFAVRTTATTASLVIAANHQQAQLAALDSVPEGARVATLVGAPCNFHWPLPRRTHLGSMVILRREGFSNDQWLIQGINLLYLKDTAVRLFAADPSELVHPSGCRESIAPWSTNEALRALPRQAFDYLWLLDVPAFNRGMLKGMEPVWRGPNAVLYRIPHTEQTVNKL
jgi:hypothetical protein